MKLLSWNINGLRSFKTSMKDVLRELDADIICFQETKATRSVLEENWAIVDGYSSYFSFPRHQSGYSGVATYCKDSCRPFAAEEGLTDVWSSPRRSDCVGSYGDTLAFDSKFLSTVDGEGRAVLTLHHAVFGEYTKRVAVINVYCPRADPDRPERGQMKLDFYNLLELRAKALLENGMEVVIMGDLNTSHCKIDHCDPSEDEEFYSNPGRQWLNELLLTREGPGGPEAIKGEPEKPCFHDTFRALHPTTEKAFTCWNTRLGARQTNYGTRIDYILCSSALLPFVSSSEILPEVLGSDHCPVKASLACMPVSSPQCPSYSTRHWPEFSGRQQSIAGFLSKEHRVSSVKATQPPESPLKKCAGTRGQPAKKLKISKNGQSTLKGFFVVEDKEKAKARQLDSGAGGTSLTNGGEAEFSGKKFSAIDATSSQSETTSNMLQSEPSSMQETVKQATHSTAWKSLLKGPPVAPLCKGHSERCVLRTVKKPGPNLGRQFFVCPRPEGHSSDPNARCNFFQWVNPPKRTKAAAEVALR
ncbi:DNA-(apurinic or apyrimidinic site) endonuclease 2-like [Dermacentor andersoni]|uniref:DNA-(apurinic or apyrimidinic site) endonuclease 2-like n=1 Tax=Dermacentor andersoni TaxID=34620 RepID=UPI00215555A1|nr:DNA-(apurinic or apyrimidinic site) endonuclease 2-like [Dermacentor andersoni]